MVRVPKVTTLREAREKVLKGREDQGGIRCPCCKQLAKVYRRTITGATAYGLIKMIDLYLSDAKKDWIHVKQLPRIQGRLGGGDFAKLRYFGLIKAMPEAQRTDGQDKRRSGFWKPTQLGYDFVLRKKRVPRAVYLYDGNLLRIDEKTMSIDDALGSQHSYSEVMAATNRLGQRVKRAAKKAAKAKQMSLF